MSMFDWLMESKDKAWLAKQVVTLAKENAALRDQCGALEHEIFWLKAITANDSPRIRKENAAC